MSSIGYDQLVIHMKNETGNDFGYVVIDSIYNNTSSGGMRIMEDVSLDNSIMACKEVFKLIGPIKVVI